MRAVCPVEAESTRDGDVAGSGPLYGTRLSLDIPRHRVRGVAARPAPGRPAKSDAGQCNLSQAVITDTDPRGRVRGDVVSTGAGGAVDPPGVRCGAVDGRWWDGYCHQTGLTPQCRLHRTHRREPQQVQRWKSVDHPASRTQATSAPSANGCGATALQRRCSSSSTATPPLTLPSDTGTPPPAGHGSSSPGYAPDPPSTNGRARNIKTDHTGRAGITSDHHLEATAEDGLHRLQQLSSSCVASSPVPVRPHHRTIDGRTNYERLDIPDGQPCNHNTSQFATTRRN